MRRWLRVVRLLIAKELRLEWRGKELVTLLLCNSIITSVLVGAGVSSAMLDSRTTTKIYPMLLWVVFLLSATTSVSRSSETELEGRGFEGLLLAGVTGSQMYLAKVVVMSIMFFLNFLLLVFLLAATLDQRVAVAILSLFLLGAGSCVALASLVVVLSGIAGTSRLRGVLVPILSLPLLFPLFFAGVEMTTQVLLYGAIDPASAWPSILICATSFYFIVGLNLFEVAIKD